MTKKMLKRSASTTLARSQVILLLSLVFILLSTGCADDQQLQPTAPMEKIGVLRSTDQGQSWEFLGDARFPTSNLVPVDPSPLAVDDEIVLYFLDITTLNRADSDSVIYRVVTSDGVEFSQPAPAFGYPENMTDPYVLALADGTFRLFAGLPDNNTIVAALSKDGVKFDRDANFPTILGAVPGALLLPDQRIRLFVAGPEGIVSRISPNGVEFIEEPGVRIPLSGIRVTDPHPINLKEGGYLMVFVVHPVGEYASERERLASMDMFLARSVDGFNWTADSSPIGHGSVPGLVEAADGTLYIYFVDVTYSWD